MKFSNNGLVIFKDAKINALLKVKAPFKIAAEDTLKCASARQNLQNGMRGQRRLRSAWAFAHSNQSLRCALHG